MNLRQRVRVAWRWWLAPWTDLPKTQRPRSEPLARTKDYAAARYDTLRWGLRVLLVAAPLALVVWLVFAMVDAVR